MSVILDRPPAHETNSEVRWTTGLESLEARRDWRVRLAGRNWNIFSRATLGNTRAVVRYLARYTSRIAMSNQRIKRVDEEKRTVSFEWKDYNDGEKTKEMTMSGATFLRCFARHMVPRGFRRVRYFGLLAGAGGRHRQLPGAPQASIGEKAPQRPHPPCQKCGGCAWRYTRWRTAPQQDTQTAIGIALALAAVGRNRFSLYPPESG